MKRLSLFANIILIATFVLASAPVQFQPLNVEKAFQYPFKGQWLPAADPLYVGAENYVTLQNLRYTESSLETVEGYSKITTNALVSGQYPIISGYHFNTNNVSEFITKANNGSSYRLYKNVTAIPTPGDYDGLSLPATAYTGETYASSDTGPGFFADAPRGLMTHADDSIGAVIYGSDGISPNVVIVSSDSSLPVTDCNDYTEENEVDSSYYTYNSATQDYLYIGSPWLVDEFIVDVYSANIVTSTLSLAIWDGSAWSAKTITDGTSSGGITFAQDGDIVLTYSSVKPEVEIINNHQLYWYRFLLSAGTTNISSIKLRIPEQTVKDVWNESDRTCIGFYVYRSSEYEDYTYQVAQKSTKDAAFAATVGGISGSDRIEMMFEEPIQGVKIKMLEGLTNKNTASISYVNYWNGAGWSSASGLLDSTSNSSKTLNGTGIVSWSADSNTAKPLEAHGVYGYLYRFYVSAAITDAQKSVTSTGISFTNATSTIAGSGLFGDFEVGDTIEVSGSTFNDGTYTIQTVNSSGIVVYSTITDESAGDTVTVLSYGDAKHDGTSIDTVGGITFPAPMTGYNGVGFYNGRVMLIDGNRVDYSLPDYPWIFNGVNTSNRGAPNPSSLYFGDETEITATMSLSNRYGSNIIESFVVAKKDKTYAMTGSQPYSDYNDPFIIRKMSSSIGCPASMTMKEVQFNLEGISRNGVMWLSSSGPVVFDGSVIIPVLGIENYFDKTKSEYIKTSLIEKATAYYDERGEYNLIFPSGSSATANNKWLVCDTYKMVMTKNGLAGRWYEKVPSSYPVYTTGVTDTDGARYNYGHLSSGHLMRLDHTQAWDGASISQEIKTGMFIPPITGEYGLWDFSELTGVKIVSESVSEDTDINVNVYGDGNAGSIHTQIIPLDASSGISRLTKNLNAVRLKKYTYQLEFGTSTDTDKWNPLFYGYKARYIRED